MSGEGHEGWIYLQEFMLWQEVQLVYWPSQTRIFVDQVVVGSIEVPIQYGEVICPMIQEKGSEAVGAPCLAMSRGDDPDQLMAMMWKH